MVVLPREIEERPALELLAALPETLPILPLKDTVVYPFAIVPLNVGLERSIRLVDDAMRGDRLVGLVAMRNPEVEKPGPQDLFSVGTVGRIVNLLRRPDGGLLVAVQGLERLRLREYVATEPYLRATAELAPETVETDLETEALRRQVISLFQRLVALANMPEETARAAGEIEDPRQAAYFVASHVRLVLDLAQEVLELDSVKAKLQRLSDFLSRETEVLEIGRRIRERAQEAMTRAQREYFLREQLRAIQRELGMLEERATEVEEFRRRILEVGMPEEARNEAQRELARLETVPHASPEYGVIRTYLEWMTSLPWSRSTGAPIDIDKARRILDEDHYDLEKIKERILEYLAVRKLKEERTGQEPGEEGLLREPILCFIGPPGVGKTSLAQSIARALGRAFVRISLGGVRDEAEIRGHRRTYVGAMPGRIIQGIRRAGANDPVFVLDEIDKLTVSFQGDPAAALLEVLDPTQNHTFTDHYLGVPFDLSKVMFITTGNTRDTIPGPLLDRMEVIELSGYTEEEKLHIAQRFLVPRQIAAHGLRREEVAIGDDTIRRVVREYTREAGVRNLERQIAAVIRRAARQIADGAAVPIVVTPQNLPEYLGPPRYAPELAERITRPGVAIGLAWTPVGGEIMFVEATIMPARDGELILTGMLGDVMRESAQAALSYLRTNAPRLGIDPDALEGKDVHIHVPAGAIPKDGPSAGITMVVALASAATGRLVRDDVAMTGEITLRGRVLPVGGIKEKLLAAYRAGIRRAIMPRHNERDLSEVPEEVRRAISLVLIDSVDEALEAALGKAAAAEMVAPRALPARPKERIAARTRR